MQEIDFEYVRFGFENCEILDVIKNDFVMIDVSDVSTRYYYMHYNGRKYLRKSNTAKYVCLELKKQSNKEYYPFEIVDYKTTVFKRLEQGDITSIDFLDKNKKSIMEFYPIYDGNEFNSNQTTRINVWDNFEVRIAEE